MTILVMIAMSGDYDELSGSCREMSDSQADEHDAGLGYDVQDAGTSFVDDDGNLFFSAGIP
jgi:hypothetical protein